MMLALIGVAFAALLLAAVESVSGQHQNGCKMTDLDVAANIPDGYERMPTQCPKIGYKKVIEDKHALGFYIVVTPFPTSRKSLDADELRELVRTQILVTQVQFDKRYGEQLYENRVIEAELGYPKAIIEGNGACGLMVVKLPLSYAGLEGIERRKGLICVAELPPTGSKKWTIINAFVFEMNLDPQTIRPTEEYDQLAEALFGSLRLVGDQ